MATMTPEQIYQLARSVGFPPQTATSMVAIALKESGGNPSAFNGTAPDRSYGLWQINMHGSLGPARRQEFGLAEDSDLFDPETNARAAYAIWAGNDANLARHWYIDRGINQSRYLQFLPAAEQAAAAIEGFGDSLWSVFNRPAISTPLPSPIVDPGDDLNSAATVAVVLVAAAVIILIA